MAFAGPPTPKSVLGYYRMLSPSAAVRVSPLCLGGMSFGDNWKDLLGECDQQTSEEILDHFYENGGNFIDTANNYQKGQSEQWIGEWMKKRGVRDQMVIATKYTTPYRATYGGSEIIVNTGGNGAKSLHLSLENSLKNLQTTYIDLLYIHWWDFKTSIPELMHSLNKVVLAGKVLYLGVSDTPAWIVSKANEYARCHGLCPFSVYQGQWSAAHRDFERDIIPMCVAEGMGIAPWGALGGGAFKTEAQLNAGEGRSNRERSESVVQVSKALEKIANRKGTAITSVALSYVMHKTPYVFPIVGCRKLEHLKGNIEALSVTLSNEEIKEIEGAAPFDIGFPLRMLGQNNDGSWLNAIGGYVDYVELPKPIAPRVL
ncbi:NADP-dependent oxidoreductase domain-containing protein [Xylogone sp. PMI_703]|nr:NADP-dependent oxidoreductase domain-containing protein [Xylogone sp. PMI_703]